eukprot:gene1446-biopygen1151
MERSARCLELALQVRDLEERRGRAAGESTPLRQQINGLEETLAQELAAAERERERLPAQPAEARQALELASAVCPAAGSGELGSLPHGIMIIIISPIGRLHEPFSSLLLGG